MNKETEEEFEEWWVNGFIKLLVAYNYKKVEGGEHKGEEIRAMLRYISTHFIDKRTLKEEIDGHYKCCPTGNKDCETCGVLISLKNKFL